MLNSHKTRPYSQDWPSTGEDAAESTGRDASRLRRLGNVIFLPDPPALGEGDQWVSVNGPGPVRPDALRERYSPPPGEDGSFFLATPLSASRMLQGEAPAALGVYNRLHGLLCSSLRGILTERKLDLAIFRDQVGQVVDSLERNGNALLCLCKIVPSRGYLFSHCVNVCILLAAFALHSGKSRDEAISAGVAGLFHDIGMAALPLSILRSSSVLTPTEEVLMRRHPLLACEILSAVPDVPREALYAALEHHEHYDGTGYPAGLSGSNISFIGHATAIASAFDAISSRRRHRESVHPHDALALMFKGSSKQFHPVLSASFVKMVGIYPVGSVVELRDGYRAIVSGNTPDAILRPNIVLFMDPDGRRITPLECNMKREKVADIARCLSAESINLDVASILGFPDIKGNAPV